MKNQGYYPKKLLTTPGFRCLAGVFFVPVLWAQVNVLTSHNDSSRSGQNLQETLLSPSNVNSTNFGLLFSGPLATDGAVDAQPLYVNAISVSGTVRNVLYVATENDSLYAFDADTGTQLWKQSLLSNGETAVPVADVDSGQCTTLQIAPIIGITATPAIDLSFNAPDGTIFLVTMSVSGSNYYQRLHALDLVTGAELSGWPVVVQATYPSAGPQSSNGLLTFNPQLYKERAGLLISNGIVYTTWASHCDGGPYNAWVIGYKESTKAQVVLNLTPNGAKGGIWQSGVGPAVDAGGDLYFTMGNGTFDGTLNASGFPADADFGNAFIHLSTLSGLTVQDYFTSDNSPTETESQNDDDLGSGGVVLLPTLNDSMGTPHALAVGAGKDGIAYVVDRNNMGKYNGGSNAVYQQFQLGGLVLSSPAWFNNTLYYNALGQPLAAYPYSSSNGSFGSAIQGPVSLGRGATPSISALGSTNGIAWAVNSGSPTVLYAFNASNMSELYDSTQAGSRDTFGTGNHFTTPTIANGKVYVGTTSGVGVFGLLPTICTYPGSASYGNSSFNSDSHQGGIGVAASNGCAWNATTTSNFITLTGATSGSGNGSVNYSLAANLGEQRTGTIEAAGHVFTITQAGNTSTSGLAFYPLTPCRIIDTRAGFGFEGAFGAPSLVEDATRSFPIPNSFCGVQPTQAYSLNVTAVQDTTLSYLTAWPAGLSIPNVSTLNAPQGNVVANAAILTGGTDAAISLFASNPTGVLVDINGYFAPPNAPQALAFYPLSPCRVADTRNGFGFSGAFGPPELTGGVARTFPMQGSCDLPATALAYSVRMTVVPPGPLSYLTTWPYGETLPNVSTLNAPAGGVVGNQAIVPAGTDASGSLSVFASDDTNLLLDVNGYFGPPGGSGALYFYPITPCRIADTRTGFGFSGEFGPPSLVAGATRPFPLQQSSCGIPSSAQAYSLNLTAVVPSGGDLVYLTAFPAGETVPNASTLNAPNGGVVASAAIVPAGSGGAINVFSSNTTDLLIDINGYFAQ